MRDRQMAVRKGGVVFLTRASRQTRVIMHVMIIVAAIRLGMFAAFIRWKAVIRMRMAMIRIELSMRM